MFSEIRIQNFKSIQDMTLKPGRVTVLIGENGSGKSNILEAIGFAAAAATDKLENPYFFNRGMRVCEPSWMKSAFPGAHPQRNDSQISLTFKQGAEIAFDCALRTLAKSDEDPTEIWETTGFTTPGAIGDELSLWNAEIGNNGHSDVNNGMKLLEAIQHLKVKRREAFRKMGLSDFIIYAPDYSVLRNLVREGAIQPLGAKGEGLLELLFTFTDTIELIDLKDRLGLFGWFEDFKVPDPGAIIQQQLQIKDKWLAPEHAIFDQRSANEGFLFVLFYFTLLMSKRAPKFFAIDNIDTALNPRLCAELIMQIVELAKKYDKQVICTTHNPAVLDGLNLDDDEQRLFVVRRDSEGRTMVRRIRSPQPQPGETPVRMSEAFIGGLIGGLPVNF